MKSTSKRSFKMLIFFIWMPWYQQNLLYKICLVEICLEFERKLQKSRARLSVFNGRVLLWYFGGLLIAVRRRRNVKWCKGWGQINLLWLIVLTFLNTRWSSTCNLHLQICSTRSIKQMWVITVTSQCWAAVSLHLWFVSHSNVKSILCPGPNFILFTATANGGSILTAT